MKNIFLYIMALAYIAAGVNHFLFPRMYIKIMPGWVPAAALMVKLSGILEIAFALMLLVERTRHLGAWLIIALLVAVFPANIQMALDYSRKANPLLWVAYARLPLQLVLIWWAWLYTK